MSWIEHIVDVVFLELVHTEVDPTIGDISTDHIDEEGYHRRVVIESWRVLSCQAILFESEIDERTNIVRLQAIES